MADIENVIKGLKTCAGRPHDCAGKKCPYFDTDECRIVLEKDALELLKEYQKTRLEIAHEMVSSSILMYQGKELVQCKDCKHGYLYDFGQSVDCEFNELAKDPDWFCADGERRDNDA